MEIDHDDDVILDDIVNSQISLHLFNLIKMDLSTIFKHTSHYSVIVGVEERREHTWHYLVTVTVEERSDL